MRTWRSKSCPTRPKTLREYSDRVNSAEYRHLVQFENGHLTVTHRENIVRNNGTLGSVAMMANVELLQRINPGQLAIDATFEICPRQLKDLQFLTIMALVDDTVRKFTSFTRAKINVSHFPNSLLYIQAFCLILLLTVCACYVGIDGRENNGSI